MGCSAMFCLDFELKVSPRHGNSVLRDDLSTKPLKKGRPLQHWDEMDPFGRQGLKQNIIFEIGNTQRKISE